MKKLIALFLTALLLCSCFADAGAVFTPTRTAPMPVVLLGGDGNDIYDENGTKAPKFTDVITGLFKETDAEDEDNENLKESVANVLTPFVLGVISGNYDEYYAKLEQEITELADLIRMDENGDPRYGTDISAADYESNRRGMTTPNRKTAYDYTEYHFWYDWRRDPMAVADELDAYIEGVCAMTGFEQVGLSGRCLGSNFVLAYLAKYGSKGRIAGLALDAGMMDGEDPVSEAISGKFKTDGDSVNRFIADMEALNGLSIDPLIKEIVDFLEHAQILTAVSAAVKMDLYDKVVEGVTSALALSTMFTMPAYWSCVSNDDYDDAMLYVFGPEGSEKRQQYAGLIAKIEDYHNNVGSRVHELLTDYTANGMKIGVVAKYGVQMIPICKSRELVADNLVSVKNASMGATTSMIYNTLSDDYIAQREAEGKGKYISPDKQVDASTCLFPDNTWFVKGAEHANWTDAENEILCTVITADTQLTVDDFPYTQFMVYDNDTRVMSPMTAENEAVENWTADDPTTGNQHLRKVFRFLQSLFPILRRVINLIKSKLGK